MVLRPSSPWSRRQRGYTMALLLGLCVVMGILLLKGTPNLIKMNQRELEQELIFRGQEYALALKRYRLKTGGFPLNLEDLTKVRPRIIRRLWKDPITNDDFEPVYAVQVGAVGVKTGLPISGVRSKSNRDSVLKYNNKELHSDWVFSGTDDIYGQGGGGLQTPQGGGSKNPGGGEPPKGETPPSK